MSGRSALPLPGSAKQPGFPLENIRACGLPFPCSVDSELRLFFQISREGAEAARHAGSFGPLHVGSARLRVDQSCPRSGNTQSRNSIPNSGGFP